MTFIISFRILALLDYLNFILKKKEIHSRVFGIMLVKMHTFKVS